MAKLGILIPSYFRGTKVDRLIDSTLHLNNAEIFICFDSLDDPNISRIKNKYPHVVVFSKKNGGVSDTRNFLIKNATSDYFLFVDDDDVLDNDFVVWWNNNEKNIDKNVYRFGFNKYRNDILTRKIRYGFSGKYIRKIDSFNSSHVSTWLLSKAFLYNHKILFNVGHIGEDHSFSAQVMANEGKIINTKINSIKYDVEGDDKLTKNFSLEQLQKNMLEVDFMIDNYKDNKFYLPKALDLVWGISKQPDKWPKELNNELKKRLVLLKKHKYLIIKNAPLWHKFAYLKFMIFPGLN